jgi:transposase-like protein
MFLYGHKKQRVVIEFFTAKEVNLIEIHRHLNSVNREHTINVSTVRYWVSHFKRGERKIEDKPQSSWSAMAMTADNSRCTDAMIKQDRQIRRHPHSSFY